MENNWDQLSEFDGLRPVLDPHDARGLKNLLIDTIQWNALKPYLKGKTKMLDIGCGIGRFTRRIETLGIDYTGIDSSLPMIRKAQELHKGNTHFQVFREKIPCPDSIFDVVLSCGVLTYILKTAVGLRMLEEIVRVLKPGGELILIEEASISERKSESAVEIMRENDYLNALKKNFEIHRIAKVRSPDFSCLGCKLIDSPKINLNLFHLLVGPLAHYEAYLVTRATDDYFRTTSYYDVLIHATARK
jgi:SAM-dependent methyltransferase